MIIKMNSIKFASSSFKKAPTRKSAMETETVTRKVLITKRKTIQLNDVSTVESEIIIPKIIIGAEVSKYTQLKLDTI